jgi:hypothetical protein
MNLNLTKVIVPGTWRYIGLRMAGYNTSNIPIAAKSAKALEDHFEGHCFQLGRRRTTNVIVIEKDPVRLVYVRPVYSRYRSAALEAFPVSPWPVVIDHSLGRKIAAGWGYDYVLLQRISKQTNVTHGSVERPFGTLPSYPDLCFADGRIRNKALRRGPKFWGKERQKYSPLHVKDAGLALNQLGKWGWALGVGDTFEKHPRLRAITFR